MSLSLSKLYVHIIFSTKNRQKLIVKNIEEELYAYMAKIINRDGSLLVPIGGMEDHVHMLCLLGKNCALSKMIEDVKKNSSRWIKTKRGLWSKFSWQRGYGAFSVSHSHVDKVKSYISRQEEHHLKMTYREELENILGKHAISYDAKYLWEDEI